MPLFFVLFSLLLCPEIFASELPRTGQYSCYDEGGKVIGHEGTGQDGDLQSGRLWPEPRFQDNGDGTVTDLMTGLMWLQDGSCLGRVSWQGAIDLTKNDGKDGESAKCQGFAIYNDWTLPKIEQLEKLFNAEEVKAENWLNRHRFRNMQPESYWSLTTGPNPYTAWILDFATGEVKNGSKVEFRYCLLVRDAGQGTNIDNESPENSSSQTAVDKGRDKADPIKQAAEGETDSALNRIKDIFSDNKKSGEALPNPADATGDEFISRFSDNGDGTVTDHATGLMWLKNSSCLGKGTWQDALDSIKYLNNSPQLSSCQGLTVDYTDWALPNRHEIRSLIDHKADLPALPENPFTELQSYYWTSTTVATVPQMAFDIYLGSGELHMMDKRNERVAWAVRPAKGRVSQPRIEEMKEALFAGMVDFSLLQNLGPVTAIKWPLKRFTDNGDGTLTDNITGLMWLKDGDCFLPEKKKYADTVVGWLNTVPEKLKCVDYTAKHTNWQLPDLHMMEDLVKRAEGEPAEWLKTQGAVKVVPRDYWTGIENFWNLYHAWAFNMLQGQARNYPESFELHVWPVRWPSILETGPHEAFLRGNGEDGSLVIKQGEELVLSAAITHAGAAASASFNIWYEAPDGKKRWLSSQGEWLQEQVEVYHGNIFFLDDSPVFHADTSELATGSYSFYFAITPEGEQVDAAMAGFEKALTVVVTGTDDTPDRDQLDISETELDN